MVLKKQISDERIIAKVETYSNPDGSVLEILTQGELYNSSHKEFIDNIRLLHLKEMKCHPNKAYHTTLSDHRRKPKIESFIVN